MPRLACDRLGCSSRPILWLHSTLVDSDSMADLELKLCGLRRCAVEQRVHLCRECAALCGVEQLEMPRTLVQAVIA